MKSHYEFTAKLWLWGGDAGWHFVSLPTEYTAEIKLLASGPKPGFGSVKVEAQVGGSIWRTSIFPDSKAGCYVLPIKKDIRISNKLEVDRPADYAITIIL